MSVEEFIASDIVFDEDFVNDLYNCALEVESKGSFTKEDCLKLYSVLGQLGVVDSAIKSIIEFYVGSKQTEGILTSYNIGEISNNPFYVDPKFLNKMYEGIDREEEVVFNQIFLANRMSKMPRAMISVKKGNIKSALGWTAEETKIMEEMYGKYIKYKYNDFLSLEMDDKGQPIGDYDKAEFLKFRQWFQNCLATLVNNAPNIDKTQISFNNLDEDLKRFQMLAKLNKSSDIMYEIKGEGIKRAIELANSRKNGLKFFDATDEKNSSKDEALIHIELPGYNAPLRVHIKLDNLKKLGIDLRDITKKVDEYHWQPMWYFRLNEEQLSFAEKLPRNISGVSEPVSDCILYLRKSAESVKKMELEDKRIQARKDKQSNEKEEIETLVESAEKGEIVDSKEKVEVESEKIDKKAKNRERLRKLDTEFVESKIEAGLEKYFSVKLSDNYKEAILNQNTNYRLEHVYNLIYNFIDKNTEATDDKEKDAVMMFVYMKLCNRFFWTGTLKKEKIAEEYPLIYQEMKEYSEEIKSAIEGDMDIKELKKRTVGKKKVKDKPSTRKKMTRKIEKDEIESDEIAEESKEQDSEVSVVNIDEAEFEKLIKESDIGEIGTSIDELETINGENDVLNRIIVHKDETISIQKQLIEAKEKYVELLEELKERKSIIEQNVTRLKELGVKIDELEMELFGNRGDKNE